MDMKITKQTKNQGKQVKKKASQEESNPRTNEIKARSS
jgi:hypothetical protein